MSFKIAFAVISAALSVSPASAERVLSDAFAQLRARVSGDAGDASAPSLVMGVAQEQKKLDEKRRAELEVLMPEWKGIKLKNLAMIDKLLAGVSKDPRYDAANFKREFEGVKSLFAAIEAREVAQWAKLSTSVSLLREKGEIDRAERGRRLKALEELKQVRMLYAYGSLLPRIIDESTQKSGKSGREFVEGWKESILDSEFKTLQNEYAERTGFPKSELGFDLTKD